MGPRSHERGNLQRNMATACPISMLQWGRVLMNAETEHVAVGKCVTQIASMGPRSHERGNKRSSAFTGQAQRGFNGAAFS